MTASASQRETSDQYAHVIAIGSAARVIACKQDLQWIIQRKKGGSQALWLSLGYCTSKSTVLRLWAGLGEPPCPALDCLPDRMKGAKHGA